MKNILPLMMALFVLLLTACSSTPVVKIEKKPLVSDHHLMMSLLQRPITQDQQMMLAFAEQRQRYSNEIFVNSVSIKGPKSSDANASRTQHVYAALIANDVNSVSIVAAE